MTLQYQETYFLLPPERNRQHVHQSVSHLCTEGGQYDRRPFIYSALPTTEGILVSVRALALPGSVAPQPQQVSISDTPIFKARVAVSAVRRNDSGESWVKDTDLDDWFVQLAERRGMKVHAIDRRTRVTSIVEKNNGKFFKIPAVQFEFTLECIDEDLFSDAWINGIGRNKAYGFGMIEKVGG